MNVRERGLHHNRMIEPRVTNLLGQVALATTDAVDQALAQTSGLPTQDTTALLALHGFAEGQPLEVLHDALALSQPGVAHVVRRLTDRGLTARTQDPDDRRAIRIELTTEGARLAKRLQRVRQDTLYERLRALDGEEVERLGALLTKLAPADHATRRDARRACRRCAVDQCGHPAGCPVTAAVDARLLAAQATT